MRRIFFLNCPVDVCSVPDIFDLINNSIKGKFRLRIEGINVAKLVESSKNRALFNALQNAELVHVDGFGIALGMSISGIPLRDRIAGIDLMLKICEFAAINNYGIYLLGATQVVLDETQDRLLEKIPELKILGSRNGYFSTDQELDIVANIQNSQAKILFIGMSSPKKELFIHSYWTELEHLQIAMGVGGSFDVISGRLRRAPKWMQKFGLEWLFRLIQEPRRLFFRYAVTNIIYLFLLIKAKISSIK